MKRVPKKYIRPGALIVLIALVLGVGSAALGLLIQEKAPWGKITNGPWETSLQTGSTEAGLHSRAKVALFGTLALDSSEAIYYIAFTDSEGQPLDHKCTYSIEGEDPDTRWWGITAYRNFHLIPNEQNRYSYSKTNIARDEDNRWTIKLSSEPQEGNWLPLGDEDGRLNLALRLYNPEAAVIENLDNIELPRITREECK